MYDLVKERLHRWNLQDFIENFEVFQLLLLVTSGILIYHLWRKYSPYFAFPQYFWIDWEFILVIFRGKARKNETLSQFFLQKQLKVLEKYSKNKEGMFVWWMLEPVLVVYGPKPYKFFSNEQNLMDKPAWIYKFFSAIGENGVFRSNGERMKRQRKLVRPAFYPSTLKQQVTTMNAHAENLVQSISQFKDNITDDLGEVSKISTMMIFFDATLGLKPDTEERKCRIKSFMQPAMDVLDFVVYRSFRPWLHPNFMLQFSSAGRDYLKIEKEIDHFGKKVVAELKESYTSHIQLLKTQNTGTYLNKQRTRSFGDVLIEQHLKDASFTLEDLQTELITLIVAGTDTSAECLMWTLWLLGLHEDVQEKLYEEVKSVTNEDIEYEDTLKLTYMECVIKESLRCYPVCPLFSRQASKDIHFEKYFIPNGTTVTFVPFMLHKSPEFYPDPEVFNPDRFAGNEANMDPWAFLPFAEGVRSCIGKNYAMLELKIFIAYVVRNFKIVSLTRKEDVELSWGVTLKSANPISVKFVPR